MGMLTRAQIEAARDLPTESVDVPEWGGSVNIRVMTAGEHAKLGVDYPNLPPEKAVFYLLARTVVDESGAPLFGDEAGIEALARKNKDVVLRIYKEVARLNKLDADDVEAAAKN